MMRKVEEIMSETEKKLKKNTEVSIKFLSILQTNNDSSRLK